MTREKFVRLMVLLAILGGWFVLRSIKPQWAWALLTPWISLTVDHGWWVPAVGGALWATLLLNFLWTVYGPRRSRRPDDAQALGCVWMAAIAVAVLLMVLAVALVFRIHLLVNGISFMAMVLAAFILPQLAWAKMQDRRKRRQTQARIHGPGP